MPEPTEIREALAKATPGPWEHQECDDGCCHWIASPTIPEILKNGTLEDLDLIANAPAWLEALCDEMCDWRARAEAAEAAVERVRALAEYAANSGLPLSTKALLTALDGE